LHIKKFLSHLLQVLDAKDETDGVQDVRLAAAVQASNSIELCIKSWDNYALSVRFKAIEAYLFNVHRAC